VQGFPYLILGKFVDNLEFLVSHLCHLGFCLFAGCHQARNLVPISLGLCPNYVSYRVFACSIAVTEQFVFESIPEDRGPLARLELAIEALWKQQEKVHCLVSRRCDLRTIQVECSRMVGLEKSIVGCRDLINY
jgi:hypothetical protein